MLMSQDRTRLMKVIVDEYGEGHTLAAFAAFVERKEGLRRA